MPIPATDDGQTEWTPQKGLENAKQPKWADEAPNGWTLGDTRREPPEKNRDEARQDR